MGEDRERKTAVGSVVNNMVMGYVVGRGGVCMSVCGGEGVGSREGEAREVMGTR